MKEVTREKDYTTRVQHSSQDEFGVLADVFNEMLEEIQERDGQLANHRQHLEQQVDERTSQLSEAVNSLKTKTEEALLAKETAEVHINILVP